MYNSIGVQNTHINWMHYDDALFQIATAQKIGGCIYEITIMTNKNPKKA